MYKQNKQKRTSLTVNESSQGETIENKIERIVNNKEPMTDGAATVYTERKDGVRPEYNIRTDRFEIAIDAMDAVSKTHIGKREARIVKLKEEKEEKENSKTESTQGTEN